MRKKSKKSYPWWTVFIAWTLVLLAIISSAFFVFSYSMQWGKEKSNSWLISMSLSVFQSVMIVQPIKVFILAAIVAILLKKPDVEDLSEEERQLNGLAAEDETFVIDLPQKSKREKLEMKPINKKKLEKLRRKRLQEVEMLTLIKQILIYALYLMFLLFLAQQNRNSKAFLINDNIKKMFANFDSSSYEKFMKPEEVLSYLSDTFVPNAYWTEEYNGNLVTWRNAPFMVDMVSFRIGAIRLRQLRVRPDQCKTRPEMNNVSSHCNVDYSSDSEDTDRYKAGWVPAGSSRTPANSPWSYRSMGTLKGAPVVGRLQTYSGGGFVVDLVGSKQSVDLIIEHLKEKKWLDKYTRAVFVEMGVLNPYVNLFTRVCLLIEFSNTGLSFSSHQINTFQLYSYVGAGAAWIIVCEVAVLVFIIIFLVRICKKMKKAGRRYLNSFWNFMELIKVVLSITSVVMYAMKNAYVTLSMGDISNRSGEYINFHRLAMWNETFIYLVAIVCFVSILECLNLLRFNVKMSMLARTLRTCSKDLAAFSFTFCITFLAFVHFAFIAFRSSMQIYKGFVTTMESMVGHLLGKIDMKEMLEQNGYFGVCFYMVFILLMTFIVMNMFFSIMGEAFTATKEQLAQEQNQYELLAFIVCLIYDLMGWKGKPKLSSDFESEVEEGNDTEEDEDEVISEEQRERRRKKKAEAEGLLDDKQTPKAPDQLQLGVPLLEAPPAAHYLEPPKRNPNKLPPLKSPRDLPISSRLPSFSYLRSSPSPLPKISSKTSIKEAVSSLGTPIYSFPDGSTLAHPVITTDDALPPPVFYEPPPEVVNPLPCGTPLDDRPMDFLNIAPLPDSKTLYGNAWDLYFKRSVLQPISSIQPAVAEKSEELPPLQTETVLCRLDEVEARLTSLMEEK